MTVPIIDMVFHSSTTFPCANMQEEVCHPPVSAFADFPLGIYMKVACAEFQGLTGSVACTDAKCRINCLALTAPPRVCTADGFGTAYTYECSGTKVYVSFLLLVFAFMLW